MSKRFSGLEKLFDEYNRSLRVVRPRATSTFVCPLCMGSFSKEDIFNGNLSVEHVPPKSIKTVVKTMTCTRCNNTIGTQVQGFMANDTRRKELESGRELKKPFRAEVRMPGRKFDIGIVSTDGHKWRAVSPMSVLPPDLRREESREKIVGAKVSISLKGIGTKEALDRAYLHSSYLALFSLLGYPYIMQPFMEEIRRQIISGQPPSIARITIPAKLKHRMPFIDPREKKIEVSLIGTAPKPEKSCFALIVAGELVLMPFMNDHQKVIHSEFISMLSELVVNTKRHLPFHISLLEIDPMTKYSIGCVFEKGSRVGDIDTLKLSPLIETDGNK